MQRLMAASSTNLFENFLTSNRTRKSVNKTFYIDVAEQIASLDFLFADEDVARQYINCLLS